MQALDLPTPEAELQTHSDRVCQCIHERIEADGKIDFPTFMQTALYEPELGYYVSGLRKFGPGGDFTTAPETSPLFGMALADHFATILPTLNAPVILELGPGTGKLAADILSHLEKRDLLPEQYYCLELSPDLRARQKYTLEAHCPHLAERVTWLDGLPTTAFDGVIFGNEVLDAMPVHCFELTNDGLLERFVTWNGAQFTWMNDAPSEQLEALAQNIVRDVNIQAPYQSELNANITPWLTSLNDCLAKGAMIFIDYGFVRSEYYHPQRSTGTLMCHYRHRSHTDPFFLPGGQDITAHVDFTHVLETAEKLGMQDIALSTQANFLMENNIAEHFETLSSHDPKTQMRLSKGLQTLLFPHEMGELFKVASFTKTGQTVSK